MPNEKLVIVGGKPLKGETYVSGGKNTSVAVIPAALLCSEPVMLENVPDIEDVHTLYHILLFLGAKVNWEPENGKMYIDPRSVVNKEIPYSLTSQMRASYYLMGALLGRFGEALVGLSGGCDLGARPIDQHIMGFRALDAQVTVDENEKKVSLKGKIKGCTVRFGLVTVGGTINVMLAAAKAEGKTLLYNCAREPHVVDTANFLNLIGAKIKGAGTPVIKIEGVPSLKWPSFNSSENRVYTMIPDQIETGTLMIAAAATHGDVLIRGCIPLHMQQLKFKLMEAGVRVEHEDDLIRVFPQEAHRAIRIKTEEYPGFPTDLQQPMSAFLSCAMGGGGVSQITETIFSDRFKHLEELKKMGANYHLAPEDQTIAIIRGVNSLHGACVTAPDLRGGAALVIAGLMAEGTTEVDGLEHIERGYEKLEQKLSSIGAMIRKELK